MLSSPFGRAIIRGLRVAVAAGVSAFVAAGLAYLTGAPEGVPETVFIFGIPLLTALDKYIRDTWATPTS